MVLGKLDRYTQKNETRPHIGINWKSSKDLNIRFKTIKILAENIRVKSQIFLLGILFFWQISLGKGNQRKSKQMGLHQTKNVLHSKRNHQKMKRQTTKWENILTNGTSDKGLIYKIYKELLKFNTKNIQLKNMQRNWIDTFQKGHTDSQYK